MIMEEDKILTEVARKTIEGYLERLMKKDGIFS